jgi:hypothetical protein
MNVKLITVCAVLAAAAVDGDSDIEIVVKTGFPFVETENPAVVILIKGYLGSGNVVAHVRVKLWKAESASILIRADTDVKLRGVVNTEQGAKAILRNGNIIAFCLRLESDKAIRQGIDDQSQILNRVQFALLLQLKYL